MTKEQEIAKKNIEKLLKIYSYFLVVIFSLLIICQVCKLGYIKTYPANQKIEEESYFKHIVSDIEKEIPDSLGINEKIVNIIQQKEIEFFKQNEKNFSLLHFINIVSVLLTFLGLSTMIFLNYIREQIKSYINNEETSLKEKNDKLLKNIDSLKNRLPQKISDDGNNLYDNIELKVNRALIKFRDINQDIEQKIRDSKIIVVNQGVNQLNNFKLKLENALKEVDGLSEYLEKEILQEELEDFDEKLKVLNQEIVDLDEKYAGINQQWVNAASTFDTSKVILEKTINDINSTAINLMVSIPQSELEKYKKEIKKLNETTEDFSKAINEAKKELKSLDKNLMGSFKEEIDDLLKRLSKLKIKFTNTKTELSDETKNRIDDFKLAFEKPKLAANECINTFTSQEQELQNLYENAKNLNQNFSTQKNYLSTEVKRNLKYFEEQLAENLLSILDQEEPSQSFLRMELFHFRQLVKKYIQIHIVNKKYPNSAIRDKSEHLLEILDSLKHYQNPLIGQFLAKIEGIFGAFRNYVNEYNNPNPDLNAINQHCSNAIKSILETLHSYLEQISLEQDNI